MEPLASKLRPRSLGDFVGQDHIVGEGKPLRRAVEEKQPLSFILWGPPGVGKTTLARIYADALKVPLFELSAVSAGKADIRKILVENECALKVLFLDEIHRFNKAQQDFLLPYVEQGDLILIGATTENPSFEVISALLSRVRVFQLNELTQDDLIQIISRTKARMSKASKEFVAEMANGDARQAITLIEGALQLYGKITIQTVTDVLQSKAARYSKGGEDHYNTLSAFIKSMRASQPDAALYFLARMIVGGEDPKVIARRMVIFASEDVGMAQPTALVVANEVFRAVETIGYPECSINLAHGVVYLAKAKKDRSAYDGLWAAIKDAEQFGSLPIPLQLRNAPTKLMKDAGYGKGYEMYTDEDLLPEKLRGRKYYKGDR